MNLRPGLRVTSRVDETTMVVIRAPADDVLLTCGGVEMVSDQDKAVSDFAEPDPEQMSDDATLLGKRYALDSPPVELLCTKPGKGTIAVDGVPVMLKQAKPLPASD